MPKYRPESSAIWGGMSHNKFSIKTEYPIRTLTFSSGKKTSCSE